METQNKKCDEKKDEKVKPDQEAIKASMEEKKKALQTNQTIKK